MENVIQNKRGLVSKERRRGGKWSSDKDGCEGRVGQAKRTEITGNNWI